MNAPLETAEVKCRRIGELIGKDMPKGWGFMLILASHGSGVDDGGREIGRMTYISNCQREGMIGMMREMIEKFERREPSI